VAIWCDVANISLWGRSTQQTWSSDISANWPKLPSGDAPSRTARHTTYRRGRSPGDGPRI